MRCMQAWNPSQSRQTADAYILMRLEGDGNDRALINVHVGAQIPSSATERHT